MLSDELVRMDTYLESVVKKVERQLFESFAAANEMAKAARAAAGGGAESAARSLASPAVPTLSIGGGMRARACVCVWLALIVMPPIVLDLH